MNKKVNLSSFCYFDRIKELKVINFQIESVLFPVRESIFCHKHKLNASTMVVL